MSEMSPSVMPSPPVDYTQRNPGHSPRANPSRTPYPSDLSDQQWETLAPLFVRTTKTGRPRQYPFREMVSAINYRWQTGCPWRMLPHDFPPWATVYSHFRRWQRRGLLRPIRDVLLRPAGTKLPVVVTHQPVTTAGSENVVQG